MKTSRHASHWRLSVYLSSLQRASLVAVVMRCGFDSATAETSGFARIRAMLAIFSRGRT